MKKPPPNYTMYPRTARDALRKWDKGEPVFSLDITGMGPSYEQCTQMLVFAAIRAMYSRNRPKHRRGVYTDGVFDNTAHRMNRWLGFSGTQVAFARHFVMHVFKNGWAATLEARPMERIIQVCKDWPSP